MLRSLLIPVDLSPGSDRVVGRAALLPLAAKARLTLLQVVPKLLPPSARRRNESDARSSTAEALDEAAEVACDALVVPPNRAGSKPS